MDISSFKYCTWVIFKKMKTLCDTEREMSNWTNWHNLGRKIMSIWYIFQIQLLSAIYEEKIFFFNFYWQQSVKMITNTDLLPQRYHFLLGMVKDLIVFPFDNDMKKGTFWYQTLYISWENSFSISKKHYFYCIL